MFTFQTKRIPKINYRALIVMGAFLAVTLIASVLVPSAAQAKMTLSDSPNDRAKSYSYWKATSRCVQSHMRGVINTSSSLNDSTKALSGDQGSHTSWFDDYSAHVTVSPDGKLDCDEVMSKALSLWKITDHKQFLKDMGYEFNSGKWEMSDPNNGEKRFEAYKKVILADVGNIVDMLDGAAKYALYSDIFSSKKTELSSCDAKNEGKLSDANQLTQEAARNNATADGRNYTVIKRVEGTTPVEYVFSYLKGTSDSQTGTTITNYASAWNYRSANYAGGPGEHFKCADLPKLINDNTNFFIRWNTAHPESIATTPGGSVSGNTNCTGDECADEGQSSCVVEGVGWIVCPVTNFLAMIADASFGVISEFLVVKVELFSSDSGTYTAWSAFRNIANVAFVIVFLIIIFSQLTGQGVSNYGIKKTLPRLIIAAILVNISFYVCQFAVDITQIIGGSIRDVLGAIPVGKESDVVPKWEVVMGDIFMGSAILIGALAATAALAATVALSISIPVLLAALLAILMTVIILIGRQAAIVILITLAPLAFVAFMLPNTEAWFKRWYKMFFALLLVYPIIALLYGGGELAAKIIISAANAPEVEAGPKFWLSITAMGVAAIPLIMTPTLLKGALKGTGELGAKLSGMASKANGKVSTAANTQSRFGEAKAGIKNRFALSRANRRVNSKLQRGIDNSSIGRSLGLDKGTARAIKAIDGEEGAEVEAAMALIQHETTSANRVDKSADMLKEAIITGDVTKARAAQRILLGSGNVGLSTLQKIYAGTHESTDDKGRPVAGSLALSQQAGAALNKSEATGYLRSELNSAGLKGKNNALARFGYEKLQTVDPNSFSSLVSNPDTYSSLNSVELAGQSEPNLYSNQNTISASAAQAVLENSAAAALLDDQKRAIFTARAQNTVYVKGAGAQAVPGTAAERARETAQQAAQGTAGTVPLAVDSQGTITINRDTPSPGTGTPPAQPPTA